MSRQRAEGRPYTFVPYSLTVGGLIVRPDSGIRELADLRGKRLGVAGGPVDKSWLFFRAYGRRVLGEDLGKLVEPSFGGPPLLNELVLRGELPAVLNYWQYGARLKAAGMHERARLLGGHCRVESAPGRGTVIWAALPLAPSRSYAAAR